MVACFQPCSFGSDIYCTYNLSRGLAHLIVCIFPQQTAHILYISNNLGFLLQLRPLHSFKNRPAWNAAFGSRHWHTSSDFIAFLESWHKPPWLHSSCICMPRKSRLHGWFCDLFQDHVAFCPKTVAPSGLQALAQLNLRKCFLRQSCLSRVPWELSLFRFSLSKWKLQRHGFHLERESTSE